MKRIVLTGGGTAGHVTPNMALVPLLKKSDTEIHYIGSSNGMEKQLVEKAGIPYHGISSGKLRRYFDTKNFSDVARIAKGTMQAFSLIRKLRPAVVFSKGGFVSCPVVWAARLNRIPVVLHESDMTPGLANRLSLPFADRICYTFPETAKHLPEGKGILTGIPIRGELGRGNANTGRKLCNFDTSKPVLVIIGGSQGAEAINATVREILDKLLQVFYVCHICGKGNTKPELVKTNGYMQFEYVSDELPHLFAMADAVISRAGATTLFELLYLKKPALLIPLSVKASRGDQILNARSFEKQGYSYVLPEEKLSTATLYEGIVKVYTDRQKLKAAMSGSGAVNAAERIAGIITGYLKD